MSNTVAVVSVVSGAVVGTAGVLVAGVGGWRDRAAQRRAARTARRADAYVAILEMSSHVGQWVATVHPISSGPEDAPPHPLPSADRQALAFAQMDAHASSSVHEVFMKWREAVDAALHQDLVIKLRQEARDRRLPNEPFDEYMDVPGAMGELHLTIRPAEAVARKALRDVIRAELGRS